VNPVVYIPMMSPAEIDTPRTVVACGSSVLMYVPNRVMSVMKPNPQRSA